MEIIILIAAILLIIFLGIKLKNVIAVIALIIGFIIVGLILLKGVKEAPFVAFGSLALVMVILFPIAYFQNKKEKFRREREDAIGKEIWLKAEEERQKQKEEN